MNKEELRLSVIIVTYSSQQDILNCIGSIFKVNDIEDDLLEIIVVDNSTPIVFDETKKIIENAYQSRIQIVHNHKNGGYGQGNNIGIEFSNADHVLIVNPDVILQTNMFAKALQLFTGDNKLGIIGGKQIGGKNISFWNLPELDFFVFTAPLSVLFNKLGLYHEKFFYLSGALLFIDKRKFAEIGNFDERLFLYCEEADIIRRFRKLGYHSRYESGFVYRHLVDGRDDVSDRSFTTLMNSSKYYLEKHGFSFARFLIKKIYSYRVMKLLYRIAGKKGNEEKTIMYLVKFKKLFKEQGRCI